MVLYRKYRPETFDDITGQTETVQIIRNQIISNRINHAYLFYGLRGSGKTSIARILARAVNCTNPVNGNPCCQCEACKNNATSNADIIEIDGASNNSVDVIRDIIDEASYLPLKNKYKVYIIDEVHMLSNSALSALLKTIEEPPKHCIFILATTDMEKVLDTIKSRCQKFLFRPLSIQDIVCNMKSILQKENINNISDEALEYIAEKADGSARDSLSLLDQCILMTTTTENMVTKKHLLDMFGDLETDIVDKLCYCIERHDVSESLNILKDSYYNGVNMEVLLKRIYKFYYDKFLGDLSRGESNIYEKYVTILGQTLGKIKYDNNKMIIIEIMIIQLCKLETISFDGSPIVYYNSVDRKTLNISSVDTINHQFTN